MSLKQITLFNKEMEAKNSQLYLVFQNKAHHYKNIQTARSRVQDHLSPQLNHTIDSLSKHPYDRDFPVNKRYSIQTENKNLTARIASINQSNHKTVQRDGSYSRYNKFQRSFRNKKPFQAQEERLIQLENEKIKQKIERMRSGSSKYWQAEYRQQSKFAKKQSSLEHRSSRQNLKIDKGSFLAKPYLELLDSMHEGRKKSLYQSKTSKKEGREVICVQPQKLFTLPHFTIRQSGLKKSKVSLQGSSSQQGKTIE